MGSRSNHRTHLPFVLWIQRLFLLGTSICVCNVVFWHHRSNYYYHYYYRAEGGTTANTTLLLYQHNEAPASSLLGESNESSNLTVALCHRTLFGNISMQKLRDWAAYHRRLGFDHVYLWYRPDVAMLPRWDDLIESQKEWITTSEYRGSGAKHGQARTELECLHSTAKHYDWVLIADADEYLWWNRSYVSSSSGGGSGRDRSRTNVKDFVESAIRQKETYRKGNGHTNSSNSDVSYVTLGKHMYTSKFAVATGEEEFAGNGRFPLARHPFTAGKFCYGRKKQQQPDWNRSTISLQFDNHECTGWQGRRKVIAKPSHHRRVNVHGDGMPAGSGLHLPTYVAHLKEWPGWLVVPDGDDDGEGDEIYQARINVIDPPRDVIVKGGGLNSDYGLHDARMSHEWNADGTLTLRYDRHWHQQRFANGL